MKRLNNIEFANILVLKLKETFKKNPTHTKFDFEITTEILSEQFNERVVENVIGTEIKCTIEIIKLDIEIYRIKGELNTRRKSPYSDWANSPFGSWGDFG